MKRVATILLLALVGSRSLTAQSVNLGTGPTVIELTVAHDTAFGVRLARGALGSVKPLAGVRPYFGDTTRAKHHYVRNGAMIGGGIGFVAGAIGGGFWANQCVNCSKGPIIVGVGAAGAVVGATLGGVIGRAIGLTRQ